MKRRMYGKKSERQELYDNMSHMYDGGFDDTVIQQYKAHKSDLKEFGSEAERLVAQSYMRKRHYDMALGLWNRVLSGEPRYGDSSRWYWQKIDCLIAMGHLDSAQAECQSLLDDRNGSSWPTITAQHKVKMVRILESANNKTPKRQRTLLAEALTRLTNSGDIQYANERIQVLDALIASVESKKRKETSSSSSSVASAGGGGDVNDSNKKHKTIPSSSPAKDANGPNAKPKTVPSASLAKDANAATDALTSASEQKLVALIKGNDSKLNELLGLVRSFKPQCTICMSAMRTIRFHCGHVISCKECAESLVSSASAAVSSSSSSSSEPLCPHCRKPCRPFLDVFL